MSEENNIIPQEEVVSYDDDNIRHLSDMEHVRTRPGMYIGRLGDGSLPEDGIYVLLKEVIDNSIDEPSRTICVFLFVTTDEASHKANSSRLSVC